MADPVTYNVSVTDLQAKIDALPKYLNQDIILNSIGNMTGTITVEKFFGPGSLTLKGIDLTGKMFCSNCKCKISIRGATIREPVFQEGETKRMIEIGNCTGMEIMGTSIIGTSTQCTGIVVACLDFLLYDTSIIGCATALFVDYRSIVTVKTIDDTVSYENNNIGIYVYGGGIVILANDTPDLLGGTSNVKNGGGVIFKSDGTLI